MRDTTPLGALSLLLVWSVWGGERAGVWRALTNPVISVVFRRQAITRGFSSVTARSVQMHFTPALNHPRASLSPCRPSAWRGGRGHAGALGGERLFGHGSEAELHWPPSEPSRQRPAGNSGTCSESLGRRAVLSVQVQAPFSFRKYFLSSLCMLSSLATWAAKASSKIHGRKPEMQYFCSTIMIVSLTNITLDFSTFSFQDFLRFLFSKGYFFPDNTQFCYSMVLWAEFTL